MFLFSCVYQASVISPSTFLGPLEDLRSVLFRYMQPWRGREVLHVGLVDTVKSRVESRGQGGGWVKAATAGQVREWS